MSIHTAPDVEAIASQLKALGDPVRLRLLRAIAAHAGGESCVCDLLAQFDVSQPTISHHLKVLRENGLLTSERRGTWVYYRVVPDAMTDLADALVAMSRVTGEPEDCQ